MKHLMMLTFFFFLCVFSFADDQHLVVSSNKSDCSQELKYNLCVCAIFKDEAPYMQEWIEYHKLLGVEHFRLYNNDSTDNFQEVLEPYILSGEVSLLNWPSNPNELGPNYEWVWKTQFPAYVDAITYFSGVSKWLAIIDLDEFILPLKDASIPSFLKKYEAYAGVLLNWHNFGTSGVVDVPQDKLMIETLTLRAKTLDEHNYPVKSIVRPERVDITKPICWTPHAWVYLSENDMWISPNFQPWHFGVVEVSQARINHYVHRTERHFVEVKVPNKERMECTKLTSSYIDRWKSACNQESDMEIFRFVPRLREQMFLK